MSLNDAIIGLIIAAIVSILTLTIKNVHDSKCWTKNECFSCSEKRTVADPDTPPPTPVIHTTPEAATTGITISTTI